MSLIVSKQSSCLLASFVSSRGAGRRCGLPHLPPEFKIGARSPLHEHDRYLLRLLVTIVTLFIIFSNYGYPLTIKKNIQ